MSRQIRETRIVVLNYNGRALMAECLPSILEAARYARRKTTVTVLDNQSTDGSVEFLRSQFPSVHIMKAKANRVLFSYNEALAQVPEPVAILLNNDIRVDKNSVDPLIDPFEKSENVFAVGAQCRDFDGRGFQGEKSIGGMRCGLFWTNSRYPGYEQDKERPSWTAQVALGAFDREKFLKLGGYDDLYFPGMLEDTDISFQAYRYGWHCLYEPQSIIYHKGQVTFHKAYGSAGRAVIAYRNTFLFMWKNFSGLSFCFSQLGWVPLRILFAMVRGNWALGAGFFQALLLRSLALSRKKRSRLPFQRTEKEILALWGSRDPGAHS